MRVLHIILGKLAVVLFPLFGNGISNELFLQEKVSRVCDVRQHHLDVGIHPAASLPRGDALGCKFPLCFQSRLTVQEILENPSHNLRFLRHDDQLVTFPAVSIDAEFPIRYALFKAFSCSPLHIFRNAAALFLRKGCKDSEHQFAVTAHGIDMLLLETYFHTNVL